MEKPKLESFREHLDEQSGLPETPIRQKYEEGYEAFKVGVLMQQMREEQGLTQQELAERCGTTKSYISRIENNGSDIRYTTLMRIFREGFGKTLRLVID